MNSTVTPGQIGKLCSSIAEIGVSGGALQRFLGSGILPLVLSSDADYSTLREVSLARDTLRELLGLKPESPHFEVAIRWRRVVTYAASPHLVAGAVRPGAALEEWVTRARGISAVSRRTKRLHYFVVSFADCFPLARVAEVLARYHMRPALPAEALAFSWFVRNVAPSERLEPVRGLTILEYGPRGSVLLRHAYGSTYTLAVGNECTELSSGIRVLGVVERG